MKSTSNKEFNHQVCLLQAIAIIMVVLGHTEKSGHYTLSILNWIPLYSCHLPIFLFLSGYLYKSSYDRTPVSFITKKAKNLLIPYYAINGFFLAIQSFMHKNDFNIGAEFSISNWLLQPWKTTQPLTFAIPSWFIFALFLAYIIFITARFLMSRVIKNAVICDLSILIIFIFVSIISIHYINSTGAPEIQIVYLRSVIMVPFMQLGYIYKSYLECRDKMNNISYFSVLFILQLILILTIREPSLRFGLYGVKDFVNAGIPFYVAGITGIAFWLRISRILSSCTNKSRLVTYIGQNTKHIMMFHLFGFFLLNCIINLIYKSVDISRIIYNFNPDSFRSNFYYTAADNPRANLLYLIFGIGFSLIMSKMINTTKAMIHKKIKQNPS